MMPLRSSNRRMHKSNNEPRGGMTLYEVVVALAIFLGSLAVLSQAVATGSRAASQAKLRSEAVMRCEQKMAELVAGVQPLEKTDEADFEDDEPNWSWSADVAAGPTTGLLYVVVTAAHTGSNANATVSYSLSRLVRDPEVFIIAAELAAAEKEEEEEP
jgi:type II secretion system protein I